MSIITRTLREHNARQGIADPTVRALLAEARKHVDAALDAAMRHEGLDPEDGDDLGAAETHPSTAALRAALRMLEGEV